MRSTALVSRARSAAGSSASRWRGGRWPPTMTTGPIAMPGTRTEPLNRRGTVAATPSAAPSLTPAAASSSASSIATVSITSTSSAS